MALNFGTLLILPCQDLFSREMAFTPVASQPGGPAYTCRGIFSTRAVDIQTDEGVAIIDDQETIVDIRESEFVVLPQQGDRLNIPAEGDLPALGDWEVVETSTDGGGETTLVVRKWEP